MRQEKLLMIPGPTPVHPRIIHSLSEPTVSHVDPVFAREMKEALLNLRKIVFCEDGEPFIIAGAGTLAMEIALLNTMTGGDNLLILSQGYFGERMSQIAESFGWAYDILQCPLGEAVPPDDLKKQISLKDYAVVTSTHIDTATGACAPVKEYARVLEDSKALYIIDGVCATGGVEERMDRWGVDVILTAAQKCFGVPPGLAVLVFSEKAIKKRKSITSIHAYYSDILRWLPVMKDPAMYFSTPCVNEIRSFYEATRIMLEEGMEIRYERHARTAKAIRAALAELGFGFYTKEPFLADTLSVAVYPPGVEDGPFRQTYADNGVVVAGGLGDAAGKVFRMGHMGNLSSSQIQFAVDALETTLSALGHGFESGSGVEATRKVLGEPLERKS